MPNYTDLTGKDKELATKWMNELVDAATAEAGAKAKQEDLKAKLAKLFNGPFDVVNINGGKVSGGEITPMTTSKDAIEAVTTGLPPEVLEALQQTTVSISADALKALGQHANDKIRAFVGVIEAKISNWKQAKIAAAKAKGDASHLKITVTARKS